MIMHTHSFNIIVMNIENRKLKDIPKLSYPHRMNDIKYDGYKSINKLTGSNVKLFLEINCHENHNHKNHLTVLLSFGEKSQHVES